MKVLSLLTILSAGTVLAQTPAAPAKPAAAKPAAPAAAKPAAAAKPPVTAAKPAAAKPAAAKPVTPAKPAEPAREPGVYAYLDMVQGTAPMGRIVIRLYDKEMPITTKNFIDLASGLKLFTDPKTSRRVKRPLYNGLTFHRVIPGFMIQGGDPMGNGMGGTDMIPDEFHPTLSFDKPYLLAMANAGPNTGSSQFFITTGPGANGFPTWLNGKHPIFGVVVEGQQVVEDIARTPRGDMDRPNTPVVMKTVTIRRFGAPAAAPAKPAAAKPAVAVKPAAAKPAAPPVPAKK